MKISNFFRKNKIIIVISAAVLIIALLFAMKPATTTTEQVVTDVVSTDNISLLVSASGNISPKSSYNVTAKITSKIIDVPIKVGDKVNQGDTLVKYDDTDLQNAVKIAMYNFNSAIYRRDQLKNMSIVDQYAVDQAQQQVNVTYTQLQTARNNLNNATLVSPINGEVLVVNAKVNDFGSIAIPAVVVADTSVFEAIIPINEIDINKIEIGQKATLSIDAIGGTLEGTVVFIDSNGINTLGIVTYQVKIQPDDITGLKPNMTVDADIEVTKKENVLVVAAAAVQKKDGQYYVKVLQNKTDPSSSAIEKVVTIGISNSAVTEITSGLSEGEIVIINIQNSGSSSIFNFGTSK